VECYSGHTYAQEPRVVVWKGHRYAVAHIERRWRTPEGPAFSVQTESGVKFELHYQEIEDAWAIQPLPDNGGTTAQAGSAMRPQTGETDRQSVDNHQGGKEVQV
jgi:hypothetical protein